MDRYIIRETRAGPECLEGNQIIAFPSSTTGNNMIPEQFYTPYGLEFQNGRENRYNLPQKSYASPNMRPGQTQVPLVSGIDPNYLAAYSSPNVQLVAGYQHMQREVQMERQMQFRSDPTFGSDYQNRNVTLAERGKAFAQMPRETPRHFESNTLRVIKNCDMKSKPQPPKIPQQMPITMPPRSTSGPSVPPRKPNETETPKNELQSHALTRFDKLKALYKSGPRAFSGPVEKVLKWHKALQDIGVLVIFETVAKCVSIQPGKCSKNLVVRDDSGPAMQVVYYEIDFLLPELKPPCTIRVVGRMMAGTCRLQAFSVRPATGDDVATLSRRAAVASHHVAKLCKEYGPSGDII